jgi:tetratricopeptide (TPR) repeat protein
MNLKNNPGFTPNQPVKQTIRIPGGEKTIIIFLFLLAFLLRLGYIFQLTAAPYFDYPIGDSQVYYQRALEILKGNFLGNEIFFHSSPPYPYFIALMFLISGHSFLFLYLTQILIGSGNCILIYLLAKRLAEGKLFPSFLAGLFAALYGLLAFFDGDLLMIFLTLFCVDLSLLLLLKYQETRKLKYSILAGIAFGLGALDKPNLLVFVPVALWFLAAELSVRPQKWKIKPALIFLIAVGIMVGTVTLRNYIVGKDWVLVSSNGGVNFYIGNNPQSEGMFKLPAGSGLEDPGLYASSKSVAEKAMGRTLKPSEVSQFWIRKSWEFIRSHPWQELKLLGRKFLLLFNYYEVPNHLNFYYIRTEYGAILNFMPIGFWLVVPIALVGIAWKIRTGLNLVAKLYLGFLICYTISLIPFFITERYRLPMMPILIAFAGVTIYDFISTYRKCYLFWGLGIIIAMSLVYLPFRHISYGFDRIAIGCVYSQKALATPEQKGVELMKQAIGQFKWGLETNPELAFGHYDLGLAYQSLGYNSGAITEYEKTLNLDPNYQNAAQNLQTVQEIYTLNNNTTPESAIPITPFEQGLIWEQENKPDMAMLVYQDIVQGDPNHFEAMNRLGTIYIQRKQYRQAINILKQGLYLRPNHFRILDNLAEAYWQLGKRNIAKYYWEKCLDLAPGNQVVKNKLLQI